MTAAVTHQFIARQAGITLDHAHLNHLTGAFARYADGRTLQHLGMHGHHLFDLIGIDVEAGDQDHVFLAIDDTQEAEFIHGADIAGRQPAVTHDLIRRLWPLPVAPHHLRAAYLQLARLAQGYLATIIIHQPDLGRGHRQTDAATVTF